MGKAEHVYGSWSYNFISLQWTRACSSCLQVHLVALDLRMQLMSLLRNWELVTAAREDQVSKSLNNLGGPHAAQRISIRTKCEKTKQYIHYRTRVSAAPRVLLRRSKESRSVRPQWLIFHCYPSSSNYVSDTPCIVKDTFSHR